MASASETSSIGDAYWKSSEVPSKEDVLQTFQKLMDEARTNLGFRELELSLQQFTSALHMTEEHAELVDRKYEVLGNLGWIDRLRGRYPNAVKLLNEALALADARPGPPTRPRIQIAGELGTVYRQMGKLDEAQKFFSEQYDAANELNLKGPMCRAIGNLGTISYQKAINLMNKKKKKKKTLWPSTTTTAPTKSDAEQLISLAMIQLHERIQLADQIVKEEEPFQGSHSETTRSRQAQVWRGIANARLALCLIGLAEIHPSGRKSFLDRAVQTAKLAIPRVGYGDSAQAIACYIYGRALLLQDKKANRDLAMKQFGGHLKATTPAMAFCKEPSPEHRGYLREIISRGVSLTGVDSEGYTALDHAVFSGDAEAEKMVLEGLQRQLRLSKNKVKNLAREARLRKGYRELFQERLRPVLYRADRAEENKAVISRLREVYAAAQKEGQNAKLFDPLKVIPFEEFKRFGRLPRSSDGVVRAFDGDGNNENANGNSNADKKEEEGKQKVDFVIFFSYRWINKDRSRDTPDDIGNTQYRRMLGAIELFLQKHPGMVDVAKLGVWMDFACVDQDNPRTGVSALPLIITQCDAVISLIDEEYYDRAWCCVEAMMIARLWNRPGRHLWYEQVEDRETGGWKLRKPVELNLDMREKLLSYEEDRPKVLFLERQCRLLGRGYIR